MQQIAEADIANRLRADNPWWQGRIDPSQPPFSWPRRAYYVALRQLVLQPVQRAVVLLGARRVGKTTMLRQLIGDCAEGTDFRSIVFASVDTPTFAGLRLEQLLELCARVHGHDPQARRLVVFDEIQYIPDWERQLKDLVDRFPSTRFIASGSAGAALKRKSAESGAGRFTDFELPPLTFAEFLSFRDELANVIDQFGTGEAAVTRVTDIERLNSLFIDYVNFGGYPELVLNIAIRSDMARFVRADIIDKVLLRDLPSLYGITNIPELNRLFTTIAYNTGQLVSMEALSQGSGITKPTIARYLEYLEAAFLIVRLRRVDETAKRLTRERNFKVYLTNPSMRAALFGAVGADEPAMGALAETALVTQYLHAPLFRDLTFARWREGEVDLVRVNPATQQAMWAIDVKWSDRAAGSDAEWAPLLEFAARHGLPTVHMTARSLRQDMQRKGVRCLVRQLAHLCYDVGRLAASEAAVLSRYGLPPVRDKFDILP